MYTRRDLPPAVYGVAPAKLQIRRLSQWMDILVNISALRGPLQSKAVASVDWRNERYTARY